MVRAGADDFLAIGHDFESELETLLTRFEREKVGSDRQSLLVSVMACSGGTGVSFLAINLAAAAAAKCETCGLIDLKLTGGDLATYLKLNPRHTILDLLDKSCDLDQEMFEQSLEVHPSGIRLLAGAEPFAELRSPSPQTMQRILEFARAAFPAAVVDLEDIVHREQIRTLADSDYVVLVLRLDYVSLKRTYQVLQYLDEAGIPRDKLRLVANRCGLPMELGQSKVEKALGMELSQFILDEPGPVNRSINLGSPLIQESPSSGAAQAITSLAHELRYGKRPAESKRGRLQSVANAASVLFSMLP